MTAATARLVSVVVAHTGGPQSRLAGCIDSVLAQTHREIEVVVVGTGVQPGARAVVESYRCDTRLSYREVAAGNRAAAFNLGLQLAGGELVQLLGTDDWLAPGKLEVQAAILMAEPELGAAYCDLWRFHTGLGWIEEEGSRPFFGSLEDDPLPAFWPRCELRAVAVVLRASWAARVGPWREDLGGGEDADFWLRAMAIGLRLRHVAEPLAFWHRDPAARPDWDLGPRSGSDVRRAFMQQHPDAAARADELGLWRVWSRLDRQAWDLAGLREEERSLLAQIATKEAEIAHLRPVHEAHVAEAAASYAALSAHRVALDRDLSAARAQLAGRRPTAEPGR